MRTSTVIFLVLFLCLFSSQERRSKFRAVVDSVREHVHEATSHSHHSSSASGSKRSSSRKCASATCSRCATDSDAEKELKKALRDIEDRENAADKTLRTIDRSRRALDDRIRKLENEVASNPRIKDVFSSSLELLLRQQVELDHEREQILALRERMKGESIRLQAEIDLARIRDERRAVESFLNQERVSPMERLAVEGGLSGF